MRIDFYQLSRDPVEKALPQLAQKALAAGQRVVVVADDAALLERIDRALWTQAPESFLAHGRAGGAHDARQPILLGEVPGTANGAKNLMLADGRWREGCDGFERVFLLFDAAGTQAARDTWRMLGTRDGVERRFWKQDGGKWVEGP